MEWRTALGARSGDATAVPCGAEACASPEIRRYAAAALLIRLSITIGVGNKQFPRAQLAPGRLSAREPDVPRESIMVRFLKALCGREKKPRPRSFAFGIRSGRGQGTPRREASPAEGCAAGNLEKNPVAPRDAHILRSNAGVLPASQNSSGRGIRGCQEGSAHVGLLVSSLYR